MNTKEMTREQISALADGELAEKQLGAALAMLRQSDNHADWEIYHQIGDVLRSDDMAVTLSPGFASRMTERLDAEPTVVAPVMARPPRGVGADQASAQLPSQLKRWAMPSMVAAAAMATVAFITTPQLMVAMKSESAISEAAKIAAANSQAAVASVSASMPEGVVLRDPRIDDYLLAHQRFSPSVYSSAQFARSATFATDSNK
jgi:sigma-E factor negative regulatory protein RseA